MAAIDAHHAVREAKLRYVNDTQPGLQRRRQGTAFDYLDARGKPVRDAAKLKRIRSLVLPPAWERVWICADPRGHIQATGMDARGRKQYRYHADWRRVRDESKYDRMKAFGRSLPSIRAQVEKDLRRPGLPRPKVLAAVVRMIETTFIRIGNEEYARENHSFGLTTLRDRHAQVKGGKIELKFRGKSGKDHAIHLTDRRLAKIVRRCQALPGQELFQYLDDRGTVQDIDSADVNDYLHKVSGRDFTAKDFRTWAGTVLAARALATRGEAASQRVAKRTIAAAIKDVSARLGNTPAVCRKSYVHPLVLDTYLDGSLMRFVHLPALEEPQPSLGLGLAEQQVLRLLGQRSR